MGNWIFIAGTDDMYSVHISGAIRSNRSGHIIKPYVHTSGYMRINLGRGKRKYIHRLLAEVFISNPDKKPYVDHIDGDRRNNALSNLRWVTHKENCLYGGERHNWEAQKIGSRNKSKHAKNADVYRKLVGEGCSLRAIAKQYNTSHSAIAKAIREY